MRASFFRKKAGAQDGDSTDKLFYWAIGCVVCIGLSLNLYSSYTKDAPSLTTFLDLLTANKTQHCDLEGTVVHPSPAFTPPNCLDYNGYRIVEGATTHIFEINKGDPNKSGDYRLTKVAELNTDAMKRLFNLENVEITYTVRERPWP